ncbi:MAG: hypothetical protein EHM45_15185 [Desulfobacteraceae bacterium]|nr:MAG: hypothetical protein EHM45_15185 [Desulfobacteraceae bacterium]
MEIVNPGGLVAGMRREDLGTNQLKRVGPDKGGHWEVV